jgi:hypothetical protein
MAMWMTVVLLLAAGVPAGPAQTQTPPPPQRLTETVTVTAREAEIIATAVNMLRSSRDPLVAKTVADNILALSNAMAASGRVHQIGPITEQEQTVVDLPAALHRHQVADGPIQLQVRGPESTIGGPIYNFTRSSFISLCADLASTNLVQVRVIQEIKMIVVARMIADLNEQQRELIPEREILKGVLLGFRNQDVKGVIIDRVLDIADAMALSGDVYDLVPAAQMDEFRELGHMERGVFEVVTAAKAGQVNVRYSAKLYTSSVNHFVWFFIRFMLADQSQGDWNTRVRRTRLGGQLLDYATVQLQANTLDAAIHEIDTAGPLLADGLPLGDFFARGPGLAAMKRAPGVSLQPSARGPDFRMLWVSPKQSQRLPDLRRWLDEHARDLKAQLRR